MLPAFDSSENAVGVGGPYERLWVSVGLGDEAIDSGLQIDERVKDAALEAAAGQAREEGLNCVQPRAGGRCEVESPARVAREPGPDLRVLVGGIVVEDRVDSLAWRHLAFDRVQKADELLMCKTRHLI